MVHNGCNTVSAVKDEKVFEVGSSPSADWWGGVEGCSSCSEEEEAGERKGEEKEGLLYWHENKDFHGNKISQSRIHLITSFGLQFSSVWSNGRWLIFSWLTCGFESKTLRFKVEEGWMTERRQVFSHLGPWTIEQLSYTTKSHNCKSLHESKTMEMKSLLRPWIKLVYSSIIICTLFIDIAKSLSACDYEKNPETGCDRSLMTICDTVTKRCICKSGYPIEVNGRCFEYKSVGEECITSSQCFKAKCVDLATNEEIMSEEGIMNTKKGICKCTDDRYLDLETRECVQRFIVRRCFFNYECFRTNSYCNRSKCSCKSGFIYDASSDKCLPNPLGVICWNGYISENGTKVCRPTSGGTDTRYPYFRRPTYVNFMWPVFAFVLVILMFKLLKEGLERECPIPPIAPNSTCPMSDVRTSIDSTIPGNVGGDYRRSTGLIRPLVSHRTNLSLTSSMANRVNLNSSPSIDTIVSLPPPYDSHIGTPIQVIPNEQPPSYEEATRVK